MSDHRVRVSLRNRNSYAEENVVVETPARVTITIDGFDRVYLLVDEDGRVGLEHFHAPCIRGASVPREFEIDDTEEHVYWRKKRQVRARRLDSGDWDVEGDIVSDAMFRCHYELCR